VLAAILIGTYATAAGWNLGLPVVQGHVPLLLGATAIGFAVGYMMERSVRQVFAARRVAEDRERRLARARPSSSRPSSARRS